MTPETHYARTGDLHIAYQVVGDELGVPRLGAPHDDAAHAAGLLVGHRCIMLEAEPSEPAVTMAL